MVFYFVLTIIFVILAELKGPHHCCRQTRSGLS